MNPCDRLDDYLIDPPGHADFEVHWPACADCRDAVELHRLVRAAVAPVPDRIIAEVRREIVQEKRRRWIVGVALAASVLLGVTWMMQSEAVKPLQTVEVVPDPPTEATFAGDVIVVPMKTSNPDIAAFWVYPNMARRQNEGANN